MARHGGAKRGGRFDDRHGGGVDRFDDNRRRGGFDDHRSEYDDWLSSNRHGRNTTPRKPKLFKFLSNSKLKCHVLS